MGRIEAMTAGRDQGKVAMENAVAGLGRRQAEEVLRAQEEFANVCRGVRNGLGVVVWLIIIALAVFW
jgi:hypothetical protein